MLADPQSVTINGVATSLPRTLNGATSNEYTASDGNTKMIVKQNNTATRFRREIRLSQQKVAADPISALNALSGCSVYLVIDEPRNGVFTDAELGYLVTALVGWLSASSYAKTNAVLGGEY
nr:MAG: hypothetical protein 2 [Leviviridae sp.]